MTPLYRTVIAICFSFAPAAMGVAIALAGYSQVHGAWWEAAVHLAILGAIAPMIYGVNIRSVPLHSGRPWRSPGLIMLQVGTMIAASILSALGYGWRQDPLLRAGAMLALVSALLYFANLRLLFAQPGPLRARIAWEQRTTQQKVDRLAIPFTMISGIMLIVGTALGLVMIDLHPGFGRWDLVYAHIMLLGFFLPMACGTSYHVLARWSGMDFRSLRLIRFHQISYITGLFAMVIALGWDVDWLFLVGGPAMAVSMLAWAINIVPLVLRIGATERSAVLFALVFLAVGVTLGVLFAIDPGLGPRLRSAHVIANLFGCAGLLISGFGYRFVPLSSQRETMRWPTLQIPQIALTAIGIAAGTCAMALRMYGHLDPRSAALLVLPAAAGMLLFALNALATFRQPAQPIPRHTMSQSSYGQH